MVWVRPLFVEIADGAAPADDAFALAAARRSDEHRAAMQLADPDFQLLALALASEAAAYCSVVHQALKHYGHQSCVIRS